MRRILLSALAGTLLEVLVVPFAHAAPVVPSQFVVEDVAPGAGFNTPVGIAYFPGGRMLVAEKRGRVYTVVNGIKSTNPLWSGEDKVLNNNDRGLLGIAVDPRYNGTTNRWIYLLYTVDPDSNNTDTDDDAFGRLIRIQVSATDSNTVDYATRQVLMGVTWRQGPVSASPSHTIGSLRFGSDGSLLVSVGDGGQFCCMDAGGQDAGAFGPNKTDPYEDIGAFRAQYIGSLAGKILRINPDNGQGYASNPYYDGNLASVQSRVWAYGLRNPFRFCVRPGTGSTDPATGNPGTLYIGEVGWSTYEEMNVAKPGGRNFGWPCYEGFPTQSSYQAATPAHNDCSSIGTPSNPTSPSSPLSAWHHATDNLSTPTGFHGNASIGGVFYRSNNYPAQYRNQYFFGDYGANWVKVAVVDANDNLTQILSFGTAMDGPVDFNVDPVTGNVVYVSILTNQVRRIRYTGSGGGNTPPVAAVSATPQSGVAPLAVSFSAAGSSDFDGDPLTYTWVFGDGTPNGSGLTVNHTYAAIGTYTAQLSVSDGRGGSDVKTTTISATGPGAAFPSTGVLDNFNRANGAIGGSWVDQTSGLSINNNELVSNGAASSTVWNGATFGPDQEAYITLRQITAAAPEHDLMLKVQGTSYTGGHIEVRYDASVSTVFISTYTQATQWVGRGTVPVTFVAGDRFGARALANGMVEIYRNSTKIGEASCGNWPYAASGGRLGLTFNLISSSRLDDFGGGNVVSNANTKPTATIVSPANNSFYYAGQTINLAGSGSDAQTPPDSLGYGWIVDLYHNNHIHPSVFSDTGTTSAFLGENHDDGTGVWQQVKFAVVDKGGLTDTAKVNIYPEIDLTPSVPTVTPNPPTAGQTAQYSFTLSNLGRMPAPFSRWVLRANGTVIAQGDTTVPAQGSVVLGGSAVLPAGTYTLRARGDSLATVVELNENNNAAVASFTIAAPPNHPPVANAGATPLSGTAPLPVTFSSAGSSDPDADPLTYSWAFGDGGTSTAANPAHTYFSGGNYSAILTVSDGRGGTGKDTVTIAVANPPPGTFPATAVLDNFNRPDGNSIGGSWENSGGIGIRANQLKPLKKFISTGWNVSIFGPNQEAYYTFATLSGGTEYILMLKMQGSRWQDGHIEVNYEPPNGAVRISTYTSGAGWAGYGSIPATFTAGDRFGARALANGNVVVYRNNTVLGTISVATWGAYANGGRIGVAFTSAQASALDDFGGGDAPASAEPAAQSTPRSEVRAALPAALALGPPRPNPSSGAIDLALELPEAAEVGFAVIDLQGRLVWRDESRPYGAGRWTLHWNGRPESGSLRPGIYLVRVTAGSKSFVRRVAMIP